MKLRFKHVLAAILCMAMLGGLGLIQTAFAEETYTASFGAQFDKNVNSGVGEWPGLDEFDVEFSLGKEATLTVEFDAPVAFGGNYAAVETDAPFPGTLGEIKSFKLDNKEITMGDTYNNGEGLVKDETLRLTLCNKWNDDIEEQPVNLENLGEFSKIEIVFIVNDGEAGDADGDDEDDDVQVGDVADSGNAWIGGTFNTVDEEGEPTIDWVSFTDQKTAFKVGETFVVTLDFGDETNEHAEADFGYILTVQTDILSAETNYDAVVNRITVDGNDIHFFAENIEVGMEEKEGGVRVPITNYWSKEPLVASPEMIGEFTKLEVEMAFMYAGEEAPEAGIEAINDNLSDDVAEITEPEADEEGGMPVWAWILIAVGIIAIIVIVVVVYKKKS